MIHFKIKYKFINEDLLRQALTHKSYTQNQKDSDFHNERLEFLGDAVVDLICGEFLFLKFPTENEGFLSKKRAMLVNEEVLAQFALDLDLQNYIFLGKGELKTGGGLRKRLLASTFEALVGAIYLDAGYQTIKDILMNIFNEFLLNPKNKVFENEDYKSQFQELIQQKYKKTPTYKVFEEEGPSHDRLFSVAVYVEGEKLAKGFGKTKKKAEQNAAQMALNEIQMREKQEKEKHEEGES
ncbi:MAG TPA: ribonuclease III [Pseudobdellovibrionaceae bacterium]|nr:ribonuclease III [Pseudobdellovibrionaceae bacterium]